MTLSPLLQLSGILTGMFLLMTLLWALQLRTGNAGIVDVGWSGGLGAGAIWIALTSQGEVLRLWLLALIAGSWAMRLAFFLLKNRILRESEDPRYQQLRQQWGDRAERNFLFFFLFQAVLVLLLALPYLAVARNQSQLGWMDGLGICVWLISLVGESAADRQLQEFKSDPGNRGKTCRRGLWRYSRHPNYFFEWLHWWSYPFLAAGSHIWALSLTGPAVMLFFLYKVTGIPATEKRALESRGEDYRRYQQTTSAFFPWFPKENRR